MQAERTTPEGGRRREADEKDPPRESLEGRLRELDWPKPPAGARERILEEIMRRAPSD